tara:strand:- start:5242 stop:5421 length:180 start_codon:yes stop_codon:yes gene_type:complete
MNHAFENASRHARIAAANFATAWRERALTRKLKLVVLYALVYCAIAAPGAFLAHLLWSH